jgi:hypothetical protein
LFFACRVDGLFRGFQVGPVEFTVLLDRLDHAASGNEPG